MKRMPALFVGHGSPMNAIEDNTFSQKWIQLGRALPKPEAVLSVSAHWFTNGTRVTDAAAPEMVYDMYGFPDALYKITYPAPGSPRFAGIVQEVLQAEVDNTWGLDHGSWSVLRHMFPEADIPVFQLSVNRQASSQEHFAMGQKLRSLREQGVLVFGSGNVVHNLGRVNWHMDGGYPWADEFDSYVRDNILEKNMNNVIHYEHAGDIASVAFTMPDHYWPLLYVLGASDEHDQISIFNDARVLGSMSMTGYLFQ